MKKYIIVLALVLSATLAMTSCESPNTPEVPQEQSDFVATAKLPGAFYNASPIMEYDVQLHQIGVRTGATYGYSYKMQTDSQSAYFIVYIKDGLPVTVGEVASAQITSTGLSNLSSTSMDMTVVKTDSKYVWLWNQSAKTGFVVEK